METKNGFIFFLLQAMLLIQVCKNENKYCQEAVKSVTVVKLCPTSMKEWDDAARRKDCSSIASKQNCSAVEQFQYHCVIDGYRSVTLEVCAPARIIFGHCAEFNVGGGVIQDQISAPCNDKFPKCDSIYRSVTAYKYPDCYKLVLKGQVTFPTPPVSDTSNFILPIGIGVGIGVLVLFVNGIALVLFFCKNRRRGTTSNAEESKTLMIKEDVGQGNREDRHAQQLNNFIQMEANTCNVEDPHAEQSNKDIPSEADSYDREDSHAEQSNNYILVEADTYREEVLPKVHVEDSLVTSISNREVLREVHVEDNIVPPFSYKNLLRSLSNGDEPYNFWEVGKTQRIKSIQRNTALF